MSEGKGAGAAATVEKALVLMEAMSGSKGPCGVTQLSRQLGFNKTTVHRLLETLRRHGYVKQDQGRNLYLLTPKLWELGAGIVQQTSLFAVASTHLIELASSSGETTSVAIPGEDHALLINQVASYQPLQAALPLGTRLPLHATAIGLATIIDWSEQRIADYVATVQPVSDHELLGFDELFANIEETRRKGYATAIDRYRVGISAVAAPVRGLTGAVVAGISIGAPTSRVYPDQIEPLGQKVADAAGQMSFDLGYRAETVKRKPPG